MPVTVSVGGNPSAAMWSRGVWFALPPLKAAQAFVPDLVRPASATDQPLPAGCGASSSESVSVHW